MSDNITESLTQQDTPRNSSRVSYECHSLKFFAGMIESIDLDLLSDDDSECGEDCSTRDLLTDDDSECEEESSSTRILLETSRRQVPKRQKLENHGGAVLTDKMHEKTKNASSGRKRTTSITEAFEQRAIDKLVQKGKIIQSKVDGDLGCKQLKYVRLSTDVKNTPRHYASSQA
uniref:Uncharacterized protein n=1 Tax=Helicotheca tamesis TaxID=374047 RepID=A0A7S2I0J9_9STRA|mmetsp:Transcript_4345/g.5951  ORF Transcript_4345/g.5951 Transcript_4345/m.5951 type:complete len:174 (+) Transcript_4345:197-718(+)